MTRVSLTRIVSSDYSLTWENVCVPIQLLDIRVYVHACIMSLQESHLLQQLILAVDVPCHTLRLVLRRTHQVLHLVLLVLDQPIIHKLLQSCPLLLVR